MSWKNILVYLITIVFFFYFLIIEGYISLGIMIFFEISNQEVIGIYFFIFAGFLLIIFAIKHMINNIKKRNWKEIQSSNLSYEILNRAPRSDYPQNVQRLQFSALYVIERTEYVKKFVSVFKNEKIQSISTVLNQKQQQGRIHALLYCNPNNPAKTCYQTGLTNSGLFYSIFILVTEFLWNILPMSLILVEENLQVQSDSAAYIKAGYEEKLLFYLQQTPIGYIILLNMILTVIFIILVLVIILKNGIKRYKAYPLFYDQVIEQKYDLIKQLHNLSALCSHCGEILEKNDKFCPNCGLDSNLY